MDPLLPEILLSGIQDFQAFAKRMLKLKFPDGRLNVQLHNKSGNLAMSISSNAKSAPYLALRKSGKNAVSISFHAAGFRGGYEEYVVAANNLLIPTLAGYNARYKTKLKAKIQSREELLFPFPPQSRECFDNFIRAANNKILHPLDWQRLYRLARVCHSTTRIPPGEEEFARLLLEAGFSEEYSWKISDTFQHLLGVLSAPRSF